MRAVVQRVARASVNINTVAHATIGRGLLILLGIEDDDNKEDVDYLVSKICRMRIFSDEEGKMNLDAQQIGGEFLIISQFTLHASTKKGNRPSFIKAARPEKAIPLYESFLSEMTLQHGSPVKCGVFGADMQVELVNDGPVTIWMDSKQKE